MVNICKHMSRIDKARHVNEIVRRYILDVDKKKGWRRGGGGGGSIGQSKGPRIIFQESPRAALLEVTSREFRGTNVRSARVNRRRPSTAITVRPSSRPTSFPRRSNVAEKPCLSSREGRSFSRTDRRLFSRTEQHYGMTAKASSTRRY